jgi:pimeloyl-ACP methyl ester carboxylesterase
MPGRTYTGVSVLVRSSLALVLFAALAAGCGGGGASTTSATTPRAAAGFDDCLRPGPGVALVAVPAPGERLPAVVLGRGGSTGVVFANQSGSSACGWLPYARAVARDGVRSIVFDYAAAGREDEVLAAGRWLRSHGARRVVLVGASIGGRAVVTAAARGGSRQVDAVVSLSGERILGAQRDLLADARRLRVPTLWVSSENDAYTKFAIETRQLYRGARGHARPDRLLVVGGADHGIDLLTGPQARRVTPAVTRFIRRG